MRLDAAGMHWPDGREDYERIMALPSPLILMLAKEARYHYDKVRRAGKTVIWRGLPRHGRRPAELGWSNLVSNAREATNLWDEQPHWGEEWFVPYNELDLNYERGDYEDDTDPGRWRNRFHLFASFLSGIAPQLRQRLTPETKLLYPPFTPDHGDVEYVNTWGPSVASYDGLVVHAYGDPETARQRLIWYLEQFPDKPIFVGEWNSEQPEVFLRMLLDLEEKYPQFKGATYFIWRWHNAADWWPRSYDVETNPELYALFLNPPHLEEKKPMPSPDDYTRQQRIDIVLAVADEFGLDRVEFLGGGFAESGINLDRWERWGIWPDVSFGMYHQTVRWADEGDQSASPENIEHIKQTYFDPWHAARKAAAKFKYWRYDPEVPALTAWCAYNMPSSYRNPQSNPNIGNYRWGLQKAAEELGAVPAPIPDRTWGPDIPDEVILQRNDWSCAVRSAYGALWALAQEGHIEGVTYGDEGPRDVYELLVPTYVNGAVGLKDASGAGLVEAFSKWGITAHNKASVTLQEVQERAGRQPVLIGGRAWYHWVYVRGVEADGTLILENPSPGFGGIRWQLRDSFARLGPFSMVWIDVPAPEPPPPPPPPPPPDPEPVFKFLFGFKALAEELGRNVVGDPVENEHGLDDRFNLQRTTKGMMVYSKAENKTHFIRG